MSKTFITSRYGMVESLEVFEYKFTSRGNTRNVKKIEFPQPKEKNQDIFSFVKNGYLSTKLLINTSDTSVFFKTQNIIPDEKNKHMFSRWIKENLQYFFSENYTMFDKVFVLNEINKGPFTVLICFDFNVELFEDGRFLIHYYQTSKIILQRQKNQNLVNMIKGKKTENRHLPSFHFFHPEKKTRYSINPEDEENLQFLNALIKSTPEGYVTFNYAFINAVYPEYMAEIYYVSKTNLTAFVKVIKTISAQNPALNSVRWFDQPLLPVNVQTVQPEMNLKIGENKVVSKLSALYYSGFLVPVTNKYILPVIFYDKEKRSLNFQTLKDLSDQHFNQQGKIHWLDIQYLEINNPDISKIMEAHQKNPELLVMIITPFQIDIRILEVVKKAGIRYQMIKSPADNYMLSNFIVKCLSKLGAKIAVLQETYVPKNSLFIGIDLGHMHLPSKKDILSSMVCTVFNKSGELIWKYKSKNLPLNEALQKHTLLEMMTSLKIVLQKRNMEIPEKCIFHRDGKVHKNDIDHLIFACRDVFNHVDIEVVEIIKSGYPYIYNENSEGFQNPSSGSFWMSENHNYAILVTNDQTNIHGEVLQPIIIKRKFGSLPFRHIVSQVYWFCKLYTNNIYFPTRLPATVEMANNLAGTGSKEYSASYKRG
jgi:hypothetical protein